MRPQIVRQPVSKLEAKSTFWMGEITVSASTKQFEGVERSAHEDRHLDVVAVPAALLGALEDSAGVEAAVPLRPDAETGDVDQRIRVRRSMGGVDAVSGSGGPGCRGNG